MTGERYSAGPLNGALRLPTGRVETRLTTVRPITDRLPDFLLIGAPKAGTTTIAADLARHPSLWLPREKELGFFDVRWSEGLDVYRGRFARAPADRLVGEATPTYLHAPAALERMASVVPEVRLIASLRDPVDRFWSHYWYNRAARRIESRSAEEILEVTSPQYLEPGRYGHHVGRAQELFDPSQLCVVVLNDMRTDPDATYRSLCRHLGVDERVPEGVGIARNGSYSLRFPFLRRQMLRFRLWRRLPLDLGFRLDEWNRVPLRPPAMPVELRTRLRAFYAIDTAELEERLGRRVPWGAGR